MTTTALSEVLSKLRQLKVPNWPAGRILGDIADEIESALASAEPVAWSSTEDITDDDGCPIGTDEPRVVWGSEHPDPSETWFPLYGGPMLVTHDAQPAAKVEAQGDGLRDYPYLIGLAKVLRMRGDPENAKALDSVAERIRKTAPTPASVPDGFYLASFNHKDQSTVLWWRPNDAGYTSDIEQAGIYTEITPGYHDSDHTVPVPVGFLDGCRIRRMLDPGDSKNRAFWSAADLRAAITAQSEPTP